jgi:hypothetical protein
LKLRKVAALIAIVGGLQTLSALELWGQEAADLAARLRRGTELTSLDLDGSKPWHLKLEVQTVDTDGKSLQSGTVEEWWANPTLNRVVYTGAAGTATEIHNADGYFRTASSSGGPRLFELIRQQTVHPISTEYESPEIKLEQRTESFGKVKLDCVMLAQAIRGVATVPYGLFPMYCLEPGGDSLRLSYDFGTLAVARNRVGKFGEKMIPVEISVTENGKIAATAKTVTLQTMPLTAADFVPGDDLKKVGDKPARVASGVIAGSKIDGRNPIFPASARQRHAQGAVVMHAIIGRDGRVHKLTLISYGDGELAMASLYAVRQWTYKPYILNGEPTEVDTTITVNYNYQ